MAGANPRARLELFSPDLTNKVYTIVNAVLLHAEDQIPVIPRFSPQNTLSMPPEVSLRRLFQIPGRLLPSASPALVAKRRMLRKMVRKELDVAYCVAILS